MNKIVFDIETKNSFDDVGGRDNLRKLDVSVVGVYSYKEDRYSCFDENQLKELGEVMRNASLIISFSGKRFDIPVLEKYYNFNIASIPHFDILDEIENALSRRVSLDVLAKANLGIDAGKIGHGLDAIDYYRNGEIEKLKKYCLQDVKITKEIFDLIKTNKYLWIPQRNIPQMTKLSISYNEVEEPAQSKLI